MKLRTFSVLILIATFFPLRIEAANNGLIYQIPTAEYNALVDLYNQTGGSKWNNKAGWLSGGASSWFGVIVQGVSYDSNGNVVVQGNVTKINLGGNQLSGTITSSLGNLANLEDLALDYNQLSGSIPSSLGNLANLGGLVLDYNQLSGTIPSSLGDLANLDYLWLDDNQLSGSIPSSLGNLVNLTNLDLSGNQLSGIIPSSLGDLANLWGLVLEDNQLSGTIPSSLGDLANLDYLDLSGNQLSGSIPSRLGNLANLWGLVLEDNQLSGTIPSSLGDLANLDYLYLGDNQLSGSIPSSLTNLTQLEYGDGLDVVTNCLFYDPGSANLLLMETLALHQWVGYGYGGLSSECADDVTITGHVYCNCDSNAIVGASVQIGTNSTTSDANGAYALTNMPPDTYTATISANNYATLTTNLMVPSGLPIVTNDFYLNNLMFVINPIFDPTITSNANALTITNSIKAAIHVLEQDIANPLCVTILFSTTTDPKVLGENDAAIANISYSQYLADLQANPNKSANDTTAIASMPAGPGTGINANSQVILTAANLAAIGETGLANAAVAADEGYHGKIFLNVTSLNGLQSSAAHEIDETLGIGGWGSNLNLTNSYTGQASPTDGVGSLDLFRYSSPGVRSFTLDRTAPAPYFSINNGQTILVHFNQLGWTTDGSSADFGDWGDGASPADESGNNPPQVQDAFGSGNPSMKANEFIALDVVGYTLMAFPSTIQTANYAAHSFTFGWLALPGQSYQVQFTTNLTGNVWNNLGGLITANNMTAGISDTNAANAGRFYRVVSSSPPVIPSLSSYQPQAKTIVIPYTFVTNAPITHRFLRVRQ